MRDKIRLVSSAKTGHFYTTDKNKQASSIAAFYFYTTMTGTAGTVLFGYLANLFGAAQNPLVFGKLLIAIQTFAYAGMIPFFWKAGKAYKAKMATI